MRAPAPSAPEAEPIVIPAVERQVVAEMVRRALPAFPVVVLVAGLVWGLDGAASSAFAIAVAVANLALAAVMVSAAARVSLTLVAVASLGGFVVRLGLVTVAVLLVRNQPWVDLVPLGLTLAATHLGMLVWETKHVSLSLTFPVSAPSRG
jgi:hypothetical protein